MNELIVQPFFWVDTIAFINALLQVFTAVTMCYILFSFNDMHIECGWLFGVSILINAAYIIFIYASLYLEVIAQWLSTIF